MPGTQLYRFCLLGLLLQLSSPGRADTAYLQPESVYLGDIAELVIEYDNRIPSLYPLDSTALAADFEVLDKKSRVFRLTDGNEMVHRMQWRLQLRPRRSGNLMLPKLSFGDNSTPALSLEVVAVPASLQSMHEVYVEMEAATLTPYIGQQTQIDMRLYHNTALSNGRLIEAQAGDALIHRQVEEKAYSIARNGQEFQVLERGIELFPRTTGELKLAPASYLGTIDATAEALAAGFTTGARKIVRRSDPLSLQVRAPPPEFSGRFWLPASRLEIAQSWDQAGDALEIGDSLSWTLTIVAHGLPAESLPQDLLALESADLRVYADQPIRSNRFEGRQVIGRLEQRFAVIANRPGAIVLPAVTLKWWDVFSDSERQARLESRTIVVIAASTPTSGKESAGRSLIAAIWSASGADGRHWLWPLLSLSLLAGAIVAIRWLQPRIVAALGPVLRRRRLIRRLQLCCRSNDAVATRGALLEWGRERWRGQAINGLHQIDNKITSRALSAELESLDAALYSQHECNWCGQALWRQIAAENRRARVAANALRKDLPRLYPV